MVSIENVSFRQVKNPRAQASAGAHSLICRKKRGGGKRSAAHAAARCRGEPNPMRANGPAIAPAKGPRLAPCRTDSARPGKERRRDPAARTIPHSNRRDQRTKEGTRSGRSRALRSTPEACSSLPCFLFVHDRPPTGVGQRIAGPRKGRAIVPRRPQSRESLRGPRPPGEIVAGHRRRLGPEETKRSV